MTTPQTDQDEFFLKMKKKDEKSLLAFSEAYKKMEKEIIDILLMGSPENLSLRSEQGKKCQ